MNEENMMNQNQTQPEPAAPKQKSSGSYWVVVLILMGLVLAAAIYFAYKKSADDFVVNTQPPIMRETTQEVDVVEEDKNKTPSKVSEEIIKEIDDIEKTDVSTDLNDAQIDEMKE